MDSQTISLIAGIAVAGWALFDPARKGLSLLRGLIPSTPAVAPATDVATAIVMLRHKASELGKDARNKALDALDVLAESLQ